MIAVDCGTMFFCKSEIDDDNNISFTLERNIFAEVQKSLEDPEDVLRDNNYSYIKYKDSYYVVGEDVFKVHDIESLFKSSGSHSYFSEVRRPMKSGLLNTAEEKMSIAIIQQIIKKLVGKPRYEGEVLCFCVPGDPVNSANNVIFHRMVLTNFVKSLGYTPECINEAMALIYSECPISDDPDEEGGKARFSGVGMSFGSGMINCALSWRQLPLLTFSIEHAGDFIDEESARIAGCDVASITKYKEKHLDLTKDSSDIKHMALQTYYAAMIENTVRNFAAKFEKLDNKVGALEIVVGGGTALVPGFVEKFKQVIMPMDLPFEIKDIRLAKNPLYAVANGCLIKAISVESKKKDPKSHVKKELTEESKESDKDNKEKSPKKMKLE